jgi:hypothetical protein
MILIACTAGFYLQGVAQHEAIDKRIDSIFIDVQNSDSDIDMKIFSQNIVYSLERLYQYRNDSMAVASTKKIPLKQIVYSRIIGLLKETDSINFEVVFQYCLLCARDSTNKNSYYNSIFNQLRTHIMKTQQIPSFVKNFIGSPEFYKITDWKLPLLVSYLDMYNEVDNLKKWGDAHAGDKLQDDILAVALLRLGDKNITKKYIKLTPTNGHDWVSYIDGLSYARVPQSVERLIKLLNSKERVECVPYCDSDDPEYHYSTVRAYVLQQLAEIIIDFPALKVAIPYNEKEHFSDLPENIFKEVKQWLKDNPNYIIIRKPNYNYVSY